MTYSFKVEVNSDVFRFLFYGKGVKDGTRLGLAYGRDDFCTKYSRSAIFSAYTKHGICYTVDFPGLTHEASCCNHIHLQVTNCYKLSFHPS